MEPGSPLCHQDVKMTRLGAGGVGDAVPQKRKVIRN